MINLLPFQYKFKKEEKTFYVNGDDVRFDTSYLLMNPKTNGSMKFDFVESTGSEWNPSTKWIYANKAGFQLIVSNEPQHILTDRANRYIESKIHQS